MKRKKLLKRIINARLSKKESKKVRKHNKRFFNNLWEETCDVNGIDSNETLFEQPRNVVITDGANKEAIFKYVKDIIASADTDLNEEKATVKPLKRFEIGVFTFEFEDEVNPYRVMTSKDMDIDKLKSLAVSVLKVVEPNEDNKTSE